LVETQKTFLIQTNISASFALLAKHSSFCHFPTFVSFSIKIAATEVSYVSHNIVHL